MSIDINKHEVDIDTLFKQNEIDLCSIKELYRKLKDLEQKITQIKYIDSNLADKLKKEFEVIKKDYEKLIKQNTDKYEKLIKQITNEYGELKKVILDENIQAKLTNDINEINSQMNNKANLNNIKEDNKEFRGGLVTFMCDDGQVTDYTRFYEQVFKPTNTPCSICLVTSKIGKDTKFLTWEQAKELKGAGWTICSHTHNHDYCNKIVKMQVFPMNVTCET